MSAGEPSARAGPRGIALAGEFTGPVIAISGDDARIELHAGTEELGDVLELVRRGAGVREARPRAVPVHDVIPPFAGHRDRDREAQRVLAAAPGRPIGLVGDAGVGKTFVLAHALARGDSAGDGAVYRSVIGLAAADVLFTLYLARYDCDALDRPTDPAVAAKLRDWTALVVLDGLALAPSEAQALALALPGCSVVVASREPMLWDAELVPLAGLEPADAVELLAAGLGRPLARDEVEDARALCLAVGGHPGRIRQAAWTARARGLRAVAAELEAARNERARADVVGQELSDGQRAALGAVAAGRGASVATAHLRTVASDAEVAALEDGGLITANSPRYRLAGGFAPAIAHETTPSGLAAVIAGRRDHDRGDLLLGGTLVAAAGDHDAIALGRAIDSGLARERLWGVRRDVLERVRDAARRTGATADEGWAEHQLGTLLVCLGHGDAGVAALRRALELRHGDAARVTAHNLHVAGGGGTVARSGQDDGNGAGNGPRFPWLAVLLAAGALVVGAGAAILAAGGDEAATTSPADTAQPTGTTATGTTETQTQTQTTTQPQTISFAVGVDGDGRVASDPPGIDCPKACSAPMRAGASVTLNAQAGEGSEFGGFSPPCGRTTPCVLTPAADTRVTALFRRSTPQTVPVTVRIAGAGTVTSDPAGIQCSQTCTAQIPAGTSLTLTATPAEGNELKGFSGECSGRDACRIVADQPRSVGASFAPPQIG